MKSLISRAPGALASPPSSLSPPAPHLHGLRVAPHVERAPTRERAGAHGPANLPAPRHRAAALRVRAQLPNAGEPGRQPLQGEAAWRAHLQSFGLSLPAGRQLSSAEGERVQAAIGTLSEHGSVAQGIAHACRSGDKYAFKAVLDLVRSGVLDANHTPVEGKSLLALVCTARVDSDTNWQSIGRRYPIDERIELLADAGADFGIRDAEGNSLLHLAARHDADPEVIYALMDYAGKDLAKSAVNAQQETALHAGLRAGCGAQMARTLLTLGVAAEARDAAGMTALHVAAANAPRPNVIEVLLNSGADLEARDHDGRSALHHAAAASDNPDIVAMLAARGADPEATDNAGNTAKALYVARQLAWPSVVPVSRL